MGAKKKPSKTDAALANPRDDAGQSRSSRAGFKDAAMLATALSSHINKRFFTTYTTDRALKQIEKKKLLSP